jgi:hypothetical protein
LIPRQILALRLIYSPATRSGASLQHRQVPELLRAERPKTKDSDHRVTALTYINARVWDAVD